MTSEVKAQSAKNMNPLQRFVKMLSDIFVPIIPAIVAGGLLMGLNNISTAKDLFFSINHSINGYSEFVNQPKRTSVSDGTIVHVITNFNWI